MQGVYGESAVGVARIHVPDNVDVVYGDTLHTSNPSDRRRTGLSHCVQGRTDIVTVLGELAIDVGDGKRDEGGLRFKLVPGVTAFGAVSEKLWLERVINGKRWRFAEKYLVPLARRAW